MTLSDLEQDVLRRVGFATTNVDAATKTRIDAYLNEALQEILSEPGMDALLRDVTSVTTEKSTPEYAVSRGLATISSVRDTVNRQTLWPMSFDEYRAIEPDPLSHAGTPEAWVDLAWSAMASQPKEYSRQPSDASELFVISTNNTDDIGTTKKAYLEGYLASGAFATASVAVNGTTGNSFDATVTTWTRITRFYLDFVPTGVVTLREDNVAGTELGRQPVATELFVVSSDNVSDIGGTKKAYLEGYVSGGYATSASVAVNGTTGATFGSTITTWTHVTKFYLDFTPAGNVTVRQAAVTGQELSRVPISQTQARYRKIALWPCPSGALSYAVDGRRDVPTMSVANDEPVLPPQFHRLLSIGARMREYEKQDDTARHRAAQAEFLFGIRKLKQFVLSSAAGALNLRGSVTRVRSQLGSWYPAGS